MDAKGIINLGIGRLGSYKVNSIAPASTPLERECAANYAQWRDSELTRNRWVFNRYSKTLTVSGSAPNATDALPIAFDLPNDCLSVVRKRGDKWVQMGNKLYTNLDTLTIEYKATVAESEMPPLFIEVLAKRIQLEMCEWVTNSNVKADSALRMYNKAVKDAATNNAFIIGAEDETNELDEDDTWLSARFGAGI